MSGARIISSSEFLEKLCTALNVDFNTVRRIVLDIRYDDVPVAYIEQLGTEKLLEINMQSDGIEIKVI